MPSLWSLSGDIANSYDIYYHVHIANEWLMIK